MSQRAVRFSSVSLVLCLALVALGSGCSSGSSSAGVFSPNAVADAFTAVGNSTLTRNAANGVLSNDTGTTLTVSAFDAASTNGGTVSVASDGSFTYTPAAGNRTTDTFTYTASNASGTSVGTVTITVNGMVWWVDNSGSNGDGTETAPFNSIANYTAGATDQADDVIYLATGSGAYDGTITLLDDQRVVGEGAALVVGSTTVATAGTAPVLTASAGSAIVLASDNTVTGVDIGNTPSGFALSDSGGTVGGLQVTDVAISGTGGALSIGNGSLGTASVVVDSIASASAPGRGVHLDGFIGTFTVSGTTTVTGAAGVSIDLANLASGTVTFAAINVSGHLGVALNLDTIAATVGTGIITLSAHGGSAADAIVVTDCDNVTLGNLTIADSDESAISIISHPVGNTLTFGDVTMTAAADDYGIETTSVAGTLVFGDVDVDGGAVSGNESISLGGIAATASITFDSTTAGNGITLPTCLGTVNFGTTDCTEGITIDSASGATLTFNNLVVNSSGDGLRVTNGDGTATINLTGTAADVTANGIAIEIDDTIGDDGAGGGWMFGTVIGTGTSGIILTDLADDFTVTTQTTLTTLTGTAISITNSDAVAVTFAGSTTLGTASPNQVDRGIVLTTNNIGASFSFGTLVIDAVTDGITADAGILDFTGTAPVITTRDEHAISLSSCLSPSGGAGLWSFGNVGATALATSGENVVELSGCTAAVTFAGTVTAATAAGLGGDAISVLNHTGNITTVGLVSAASITENDANGLTFNTVTGNLTIGPVTVNGNSGDFVRGIRINAHVSGNATFTGAITLTNLTGGSIRGIEIGSSSTVNTNFTAATTITGATGANSIGLYLNQITGTVTSSAAGTFQIDGMTGSGAVSWWHNDVTGTTTLDGDIAIDGGNVAIQLDTLNSQTVTVNGDVNISGSGVVRGIYLTDSPNADIDFGNLSIDLGTFGLVAIDLRGDSDGSNAGADFAIAATDGASGITYTNANSTAIFADRLDTLSIAGATGQDFLFTDVGTGSTDGGETNVTLGPHGIFARECSTVTIQDCEFDGVGDTGTDGLECAIYVRNTSVAPSAITVASTTIGENVDGHGVFIENTFASAPVITLFGNTLQDVTSQNDLCYGLYTSLDGAGGDVSATMIVAANTIQNQGPTGATGGGGIFLECLNGAGSTTPVSATLGDSGAAANTISNVTGYGMHIQLDAGTQLVGAVDNTTIAFTPGNAGELNAVYIDINADFGEVADIDLQVANVPISGYDNGATEPVLIEFDGTTRTSDVKLEVSDCAFTNCSAVVAGVLVSTSNDCFDGGAMVGRFDVRLENNNFGSTGGIETVFSGGDDSLLSLSCLTNTLITDFMLARDGGLGTDQLQIGDILATTDSDADDTEIEAILTAVGGNNNTGSPPVFTISVGDTSVIVDDAGIVAPTAP